MTEPKSSKDRAPSTHDTHARAYAPKVSWGVSAPLLGYIPALILWLIFGPVGAGAAASGRWARACFQAALLVTGLAIFADGYALLWGSMDGAELVEAAFANGALSPGRALLSVGFLMLAVLVWAQELWLMRAWHGRTNRSPLLGDPD